MPTPKISENMADWNSQVGSYPPTATPGIHLISPEVEVRGHKTVVDCLLAYNEDGELVGIFNHYNENNPLQEPGTANLWVHPEYQRKGIATDLLRRADELWELLDQPVYTEAGNAWIEGLMAKGKIDATRTGSLEDNPNSISAKKVKKD